MKTKFTLLVSLVLLVIGSGFAQTYYPPLAGSPFSPMSIFIIGASNNDALLEAGDEIAIFDGDVFTGAATLANELVPSKVLTGETLPLQISATSDDGTSNTPNGFTDGNSITVRMYDKSENFEMFVTQDEITFYDISTGNVIDPVTFQGLGTAALAINAHHIVGVNDKKTLPTQFELSQNYPNPFNPTTHINYSLPKASHINITIFDILGNQVLELENSYKPAGTFTAIWSGHNSQGIKVASGVYFYQLKTEQFKSTKKMILNK